MIGIGPFPVQTITVIVAVLLAWVSARIMARPIVLNLWATWCPPCRREMPVFEKAQTEFPDIAFVLVNQGESAQQALAYLKTEGLDLTDVLLDPASEAMRSMNSRGLPTTLFFDAKGRLVDPHLGEITMPSPKDKVLRSFMAAVSLLLATGTYFSS